MRVETIQAVKYELVIFDFDGTLADSFAWFLGALEELAERHGLHRLSNEEAEQLRGESTGVILKRLGVRPWKLPALARALRDLAKRDVRKIMLFDGVVAASRELSGRGAVLAVVSANARENVEEVLGPELAGLIRHYECGVPLFGKAARLRRVMRKSGVPAARAIFIGDEIRDCEAARRAGIAFGAVGWGYARPEALRARSPAEMFGSVQEIIGKIVGATGCRKGG